VKIERWGVGVVICLERGAECLHVVQLMPLHPQTPSSLASFKSRLVSWYWLNQVVLEKRPLNMFSSSSSSSSSNLSSHLSFVRLSCACCWLVKESRWRFKSSGHFFPGKCYWQFFLSLFESEENIIVPRNLLNSKEVSYESFSSLL